MAEPGTRLTPKPANRQGPRLPATARSAGAFLSERQKNLSECHWSAGAGLGFHENRLSVGTGASIRATGTTVNVDLRHAGLDQQAAHKVDGIAPTLLGAALSGAALKLTWDEALDTGSVPAAGDFTVKVAGSTVNLSQTAPVTAVGRSVSLALASAVANSGQTVTVSYAKGAKPIRDAAGNGVANFADETVVLGTVPPVVSGVALAGDPPEGQNGFYRSGDEVRARVTFDRAVDVAGSPLMYLQFDPSFGEKAMTFDASAGRTNTRTLDFTYEVAAGDASPTGIGFNANKLSAPSGVTIRAAGTSVGARLDHGAVAHDAGHKVDTGVPALAAADAVRVSSSAGTGGAYAIGDVIELTATFSEAVEATAEPRIAFTLGEATKYATYRSGNGTTELAFGYEVTEGEVDEDGIAAAANALELNEGTIADLTGNAAGAAQLAHAAIAASASHKVDGVRPTLSETKVSGAALTLTWDEALDTGSVPAAGDFTVKVGGSDRGVANVAVAGSAVTLTLASAAAPGDAVTVQYDADLDANPIRDAAGNAAADVPAWMVKSNAAPTFAAETPATLTVAENSAGGTAVGTVAAEDSESDTLAYALDEASAAVFDIDADGAITVASGATLDHETTPSYAVTVGVSDGKAADGSADAAEDATHAVTVEVTNVEEPPGAPAAPTMTGRSFAHVDLSWAAPADLGAMASVTDYDLRYYEGSADPADEADWIEEGETSGPPDPGTATTATISGLASNTAYRVQVRAAGDGEGAWSPSASVATNDAPTVSSVALAGTPAAGQDDRYKLGDTVRARVTFARAVDIVGSPALTLRLDATDTGGRAMTFDASGGRTNVTTLDFTWTVAAGDESAQGIAFNADELSAPSGVTIRATGTTVDADLSHGAVAANASHKVDGVRPAFSIATVNDTTLAVTFSEALNASGTTKPASSAFTVTATKDGDSRTINGGTTAVTISGAVVTATLSSAVAQGETVTVAYAKPTANPLADLAGTEADAFTNQAVTNDTTALPVASAITKTTDEDTTLTFAAADFTGAFSDPDNHELKSVKLVTLPTAAHGVLKVGTSDATVNQVVLAASLGTISFEPAADYNGDAGFTYKATDTSDAESAEAAEVTVTVSAVNDAPGGSVTITGTATQGEELTADTSAVTDADGLGDFSYQWQRDIDGTVTEISGATASTYTLVQADVGATITVTASWTDDDGTDESLTSDATAAVTNANDAPGGSVTITGTVTQGEELTADTTAVTDADGLGDFSYQWKRTVDGTETDISGATASTYTLVQADVGATIMVAVSWTDDGGTAESLTSDATAAVTNANDAPGGSVTITGTVTQGEELTADTSAVTDADGLGDFSYQWQRTDGETTTDISGATASTYTLVQADVGATIKVTVSWTDDGGTAESLTSDATAAVTNTNDLPGGSVTITGTVTQGEELTAVTSAITDADGLGDFSYQWKRISDGTTSDISGATESTYTLVQADVGATIKVTVSWTDDGGTAESLTSDATAAVTDVNDLPGGSVTITGTVTQGEELTADTSTVTDADGLGTLSYQWQRTDGATTTDISGATESTYTLVQADVGAEISVTVSWTDLGGTDESLTSDATAAVTDVNDLPGGSVTITGTATQGQTLTADTSTVTDEDGLGDFSYLWQRTADSTTTDITGATASTYTLVQADVGATITVTVSWTDLGGTAESLTSDATAAVANTNDAPGGSVTISGTATQGQTLTADTSAVTDADGLGDFSYQWKRTDGEGTADISGATESTYTLVQADVGATIKVTVSWTDDGGTAESLTSDATAAVANVNDLPVASAIEKSTNEDTTLTFAEADFTGAFSDPDGHDLKSVKLVTLPTAAHGVLKVGTSDATENQVVLKASLGTISFVPAENYSGSASFTYKVTDSSDEESAAAAEITVTVNAVNDLPVASGIEKTTDEDSALTFAATDFTSAFSDPDNHALKSVKLMTLPDSTHGALKVDGTAASANDVVLAADLGTLKFEPAADYNGSASFTYKATDTSGEESAESATVTVTVSAVNDDPGGSVTITGTATQGEELTANTSAVTDADGLGTLSYQWKRTRDETDTAISGATAATYTLVQADVGATITVTVSWTDDGGTAESLMSDATATVTNANDAPGGSVTITGTAAQGEELTAVTGAITDADGLGAFSYQWERDGADISGATASTYTLVQTDVGAAISVKVSWTDLGGTAESLTSDATAAVTNVNDAPAGSVTITGTATQGEELTADTSAITDADGLGTLSYQWKRTSDETTTDISGATASTYTLVQADVGANITVEVSWTDLEGTAESLTSDATAAVTNANDEPGGSVTITGTATQGEELTANTSAITDDDGVGTFSYQWKRIDDGTTTDISGATASTYTLVQADVGAKISVKVSWTDLGGTAESLTSDATAAVANANDAPDGSVTITGTATQGEELTAVTSAVTDADGLGAFSYQWKRDAADISGATSSTYTLVQADVGAAISVKVSWTDLGGTAESLTSDATAAVTNANDDPAGSVTITGTATQGQTLTADTNAITDADGLGAFSYQWQRTDDGTDTDISGATSSTYTLVQADVGAKITVTVSWTDLEGTAESLTSDATAAVTNTNDAPGGSVTITGTATQGQTLTADISAVTDADGLGSFSYQWKRTDEGTTTAISGATAATYTLVQADVGAKISVTVSWTDLGGTAETLTSAATAAVANVNDLPVASDFTKTTDEDTALTFAATDFTGAFSDPDGHDLKSVKLVTLPSSTHGVLKVGTSNATENQVVLAASLSTISFEPAANYGGSASFTYKATDSSGEESAAAATVTVTITAVDDLPVASGIEKTTDEDTTVTFAASDFTGAFDDADNHELKSVKLMTLPTAAQGKLKVGTSDAAVNQVVLAASLNSISFEPAANYSGSASFTYKATDTSGEESAESATVTVTVSAVNDSPGGSVTITGTATQGQQLTAGTSAITDIDGLGTFGYQWKRTSDGTTTAISGATDSTYTLVQADVGATITVTVSWTDLGGTAESLTSDATSAVTNANDAPAGSVTITGTATQGEELTADTSAITDADGLGTFSYQWKRDGTAIRDATTSTYTLVQADVGAQITVTVSWTDLGGTAESLTSDATAAVANANDAPGGAVTITGTATQGEELTASTSAVTDADGLGTFSYQWERDGTAISGATASTYTLVQADVGAEITVTVSWTDLGGTSESLTSDATAAVTNANDAPGGSVTISGTATQGQTLTADASAVTDADGLGAFSYQWKRTSDGTTTAISGATASTYTLVQADVGATITVTVSWTDQGETAESLTSDATAAVANANDAPGGSVTITGTATQGQTLTANTSAITDADGLGTFGYQWKRAKDGTTTNISGAIASTYTLVQADVGAEISVTVNWTDLGGTAESLTSAATSAVTNVNDLPVASAFTKTTDEDTALTFAEADFTGAFSDPDGHGLKSVKLVTLPSASHGVLRVGTSDATENQVVLKASLNTISFVPAANWNGSASFTYKVTDTSDDESAAAEVTVTVSAVNDLPVASAIEKTTNEETALTFAESDFTGAFSDPDNHTLKSVKLMTLPASTQGVLKVGTSNAAANQVVLKASLNTISFMPAAAFNGNASFTYKATDTSGEESAEAAVTVRVSAVNDAPGGSVTITGTATQGQQLTANTSAVTDADGLGTFSYQWKRTSGGTTADISGATASTYTLVQADVGATITVTVSWTDQGDTAESLTSDATAAVANANDAPDGSVTIDGTATQGEELTANTSAVTDDDGLGTFSYQWKRTDDGTTADISGATASTYTLVQADVGTKISVKVSWTDLGGTAESLTSDATSAVANANDVPGGSVTITGTATQGEELTANTSAITDADGLGTFSYQWKRTDDGTTTDISSATASTYTLVQADVGAKITVKVSWTDRGGTAESLTSDATSAVANVNDAAGGSVTIDGTATQGEELTANTSAVTDDDGLGTFSYQWKRTDDGTTADISGATASTYTLVQADVGAKISVKVSWTDLGGTAETLTSDATAAVANANDAPGGSVTITGTATQGQQLTANTSAITDADGLGAFSYQWKRTNDGTTAAISGATASTYTLAQADVGATITVTVSWTDLGGTAESLTSDATSAVANVNEAPGGSVTITGTATQGQTLTADTSAVTDTDGLGTFSYEWKRTSDGTDTAISGATASTYTLVQADVGAKIFVKVSWTDLGGTAESLTSDATAAVANANDAPDGSVTIDGTATQGEELTANTSAVTDADGLSAFSYQWKRTDDGTTTAISGATASTYTLVQADVGAEITVTVSWTDLGGAAESLTSAATSAVANANDEPGGSVTIAGTATQGQALTADASAVTDADGLGTFSYQWKRTSDGTTAAISGATASTYTLVQADVGAKITVTVSWTDLGGTAESLTSAATSAVANVNDAPTGSVTISGTATQGQTLTADTSAVTDADGLGAFSYQWKRTVNTTTTAISDATASTYTLVQADVGAEISVTVSWTDLGEAAESLTSAATSAVTNVNDLPVASDFTKTTNEDTTLTFAESDFTGAFSDPDNHALKSVKLVTLPASTHGVLKVGTSDATENQVVLKASLNTISFVPAANWNGSASFTYKVADSSDDESAAAEVTITVSAVNDLPVASAIEKTTDEDTALTFAESDFTGAFSDPDNHALKSVKLMKLPASTQGVLKVGTSNAAANQVVLKASLNTISFMPAAAFNGDASFTYKATDTSGEESAEAAVTVRVSAVNDAPGGSVTIAGTTTQGQTLTADTSAVTDADGLGTFSYQWKRTIGSTTTDISGATAATYTLVQADVGATITVTVSWTDLGGTDESLTADATATVANANDAPGGSVTISGTATQGEELTANTNAITDADGLGTFGYQWERDGTAISGAIASTYTLVQADVGAEITVTVSWTDLGGTSESLTSTATSAVTNSNDAPGGSVTITGTATQGQTLTADASAVTDADGLGALSYQWKRDDAAISGATAPTYTLVQADVGAEITVTVSWTDLGGTAETLTSDATAAVASANSAPLTASFHGLPAAHDGFSAFGFELHFSEEVKLSQRALRDGSALHVANGRVTKAQRMVRGENRRWAITVQPDDPRLAGGRAQPFAEVTVSLPPTRQDCAAAGAVCTHAGKKLSAPVSATVAGPGVPVALTASFHGVPTEHDGASAFEFELRFNEEVKLNRQAIEGGLKLLVSNGQVTKATRAVQGETRRWTVTVQPDSREDVRLYIPATADCATAGAICTSDGRKLSQQVWATVAGPAVLPVISVADARADEGGTLAFAVTLDEAATGDVTVDYATADGSATAGADYTAASGTLTFAAGEMAKTVAVTALSDTAVEDDETFTLTLFNASGATIGTASATGTVANANDAPLTASFHGLPDAHDGFSAFGFELHFSEEVKLSQRALRDGSALQVVNGQVTKAQRLVKGENRRWAITVQPDDPRLAGGRAQPFGEVTVTLPPTWQDCATAGAVCTHAGKKLSAPVSATVPGPVAATPLPVLSVASASADEGGTLEFQVTLDEAATGDVTVNYATADGSATAGADYTAASGTLTFAAGETAKTVEVAALADTATEGDETFTLTLANASGATIGTASATGTLANVVPPLTASFHDLPTAHDGTTLFAFEIRFSEEFQGLTLTALEETLAVTGGRLVDVTRTERGENRSVTVRVRPSSMGDMTLTLPATTDCEAENAICTGDGRMLSAPASETTDSEAEDNQELSAAVSATVPGPLAASVADAEVREGAGAAVAFTVSLNRAAADEVAVDYATRDGTATAGEDYTATRGTLTFAAGETEKTVSVPVLDDSVDEGRETFTLKLTGARGAAIADGEATGTIVNTDAIPEAWLTRFGRTVAEQHVAAVRDRMGADRSPGFSGRFAGQPLPRSAAEDLGESRDARLATPAEGAALSTRTSHVLPDVAEDLAEDERLALRSLLADEDEGEGDPEVTALTTDDILMGTSFAMMRDSGSGLSHGFWGRASRSGFSGRDDGTAVDGDVTSVMLGADWKRKGTLFGLIVSGSQGTGTYTGASSGELDARLTGLVPWAGLEIGEGLSVWGALGIGHGDMTLTPEGTDPVNAGIGWSMAAAGADGALAPGERFLGAGLGWHADALGTQTSSDAAAGVVATSGATTRLRLGVTADWQQTLASGATLSPRLETGLRHDGGDAETGFGLEIGGGVGFSDPARGLSMSLDGRTLALHEDGSFQNWGLSLDLSWDPRPATRRGWSLAARQSLGGASSGGVDALLGPEAFPGLQGTEGEGTWSLEAAYGTGRGHGMVGSPYGQASGTGGVDSLRLGYRIEPDAAHAADASVDFWAQPGTGAGGHEVGAGLQWRW